jgi:hypothetical protein
MPYPKVDVLVAPPSPQSLKIHILGGNEHIHSTTLQTGRSRVRFPMVSLEYFSDIIRRGVDSASNRNEYQVYFVVVKAAGA